MSEFINDAVINEAVQHPDWYIRIQDEYKRLVELADESDEETKQRIKQEIYGTVEQLFEAGKIIVGESGYNFDSERQPIQEIIVHHTSGKPGMSLERLNAIHLVRIYAPYYANPTLEEEKGIKGQPIYSGHFYNGKQVFWGYHWFVRADGSCEHILKDEYIGWQAGNWDVNCRSIAICLDGDFSDSTPPQPMIDAIDEIINQNYPRVSSERILGHREVNPKTTCPGDKFLDGWKSIVIGKLAADHSNG